MRTDKLMHSATAAGFEQVQPPERRSQGSVVWLRNERPAQCGSNRRARPVLRRWLSGNGLDRFKNDARPFFRATSLMFQRAGGRGARTAPVCVTSLAGGWTPVITGTGVFRVREEALPGPGTERMRAAGSRTNTTPPPAAPVSAKFPRTAAVVPAGSRSVCVGRANVSPRNRVTSRGLLEPSIPDQWPRAVAALAPSAGCGSTPAASFGSGRRGLCR